ncbi:hypothetical protein GCM10007940_22120 [Portibacter lacus]|uniref:Secretion system C-terminal sorting domain-containing protein n=2 Tax=Portibacter lacus TaxID=1099794 RepID=A0AA37SPE0_9BACT|nr:hypothetical protein GCM10007940_22120 [Portibacter lacus]
MDRINLKYASLLIFLFTLGGNLAAQSFVDFDIDSEITEVQPMTGIVFWPGNSFINTDAVALEYSYMDFSKVVTGKDEYDWSEVDDLLDKMAARNHQGILRFRFSYPGRTTTVPQYIKDLPDYEETEGLSEGKTTYFPDWSNEELKSFTLNFFKAYAERYDKDPRLAYVQVGFGLWAEYHIYSGPLEIGKTFPSKEFQKEFFNVLDESFEDTYWSISIDAANGTYSPFEAEPELKDITFGLFDDSFMHQGHSGYNTRSWNFFDRDRYQIAPAGGEFNYYTNYDQANVLNPDVGAHGQPFEIHAQNFHISYMIGNDQAKYQSIERIKEASMACGYKFKVLSFKSMADSSTVEITNLGIAPLYIDAYPTVDSIRSTESLKLLQPGEVKTFTISSGSDNPTFSIESDDILETQEIQFFGTLNDYEPYTQPSSIEEAQVTFSKVFPTVTDTGLINIQFESGNLFDVNVFNAEGKEVLQKTLRNDSKLNLAAYGSGMYFIRIRNEAGNIDTFKIIVSGN